ncbi:MAG: tRNA (adenosine(37)-N6)-threonylcarbamoyltransferase complex dimerization subunit type 1 TsaB [SAR202 cluster bacterium]|nr:tRNA (adenosine(37)-N6)-threonylcarbamoyltransferase complex dimerization subunit type 1 TsaB [SAR202 cluster bacterium]
MLLAIDTSTRYAGVLLWKDGQQIASRSWYSRQSHTKELLPAIDGILKDAALKPADLTTIAIALGPGGFSALRVGMSAAKGFCLALDTPLIGISTLEMEAWPYANLGLPVCPILDIGRGEVAWAIYQSSDAAWRQAREPEIASLPDFSRSIPQGSIICGEGISIYGAELRQALSEKAVVVEYPGPNVRLWALAKLASERLAQDKADDAATLQPFYLRRPTITKANPPIKVKFGLDPKMPGAH